MNEDFLASIKKSPSVNVEVHEQDPDVVAGVKSFLEAHQVAMENDKQKARTPIEPDTLVGAPGPDDAFLKEALVPVEDIVVTEEEKRIYLKSLLTDELTRFTVTLYSGQLVYALRTRSMFEQRRVLDVINWRMENDVSFKNNVAKQFDTLQQYFALLMVERINGVLFSELILNPGAALEEDYKTLDAFAAKLFSKMNNVCWSAMLNAMRIFESKCAKLGENAINEDFWKPRS